MIAKKFNRKNFVQKKQKKCVLKFFRIFVASNVELTGAGGGGCGGWGGEGRKPHRHYGIGCCGDFDNFIVVYEVYNRPNTGWFLE
jgi:hypothetical protein